MHHAGYESHLYATALSRYRPSIGVVLTNTEYTTGRATTGRAIDSAFGPNGRGVALSPAPRPSKIMLRSIYVALGLVALRLMVRRAGRTELLPRLRNAGF
jgi:hypothetical protein